MYSGDGISYSGVLKWDCAEGENCNIGEQGEIRFYVDGHTIVNYTHEWPDQPCNEQNLCDESEPCPLSGIGFGEIKNELTLEIQANYLDCVSSCSITYTFERQL